jgi:hypothetical protein
MELISVTFSGYMGKPYVIRENEPNQRESKKKRDER